MGATPFGGLGAPNMDQMAAMGIPGANMNPQVRTWNSQTCSPSMPHRKLFVMMKLSSVSGSVCRLPEAHAVHGSQVRKCTHLLPQSVLVEIFF